MKKKSVWQLLLGEWNTLTIVGVAIGAALFGVLMRWGGIPIFTNTNLTTAFIVPVIVGALFGPLPAAIACGVGNVLADFLWGSGYWFDWSIGNAFLGFVVGLLPLYGADIAKGIFKIKHAIIYSIIAVLGNWLAFGLITPIFTQLLNGGELEVTLLQGYAAVVANSVVLVVVGLPILFALAARNAAGQNLSKK